MFRSIQKSLTSLCSLVVGLALVVGLGGAAWGQAPAPNSEQENNASVLLRLTPDAYAQIEDIETLHTIDYGSFFWIEVTLSNFERLQEKNVKFERQSDPWIAKIQDNPIDTRIEGTSFMDTTPKIGTQGPGFYLIQLLGPAKDEWMAQLQKSGLKVLQSMHPYMHLVWMGPEQATVFEAPSFVRWVGSYRPEYRISPELLEKAGLIENVDVTIYDDRYVDETLAAIELEGGTLVERERNAGSDKFITATFTLFSSALESVAKLKNVAWLSYRAPIDDLEDEMSAQISAGNFNPINAGYQNWLTNNSVNGTGVTVALIDSGFDTGVDGTSHQDLSGRLIPVGTPTDTNGHGTHVGGIIAGDASLGTIDGSGFLLGLGVAPAANLVVRTNTGTDADRQRDVLTNGAVASNNSYAIHTAGIGYTNRDRTLDILVRDADQTTTTVAEPLILVFSAGNSGTAGPTKEAKNIIAVANSLNQRNNTGTPNTANINNLRGSSSRGPAGDGRVYPHMTAPGTNIVSTRSTQGGLASCGNIATGAGAPAADPTYSMCTGTSMAAPHVTGAVALITEWWRGFNAGANPSPAMAKALLVNGAVDMGTADIPNGNEGWGRINLSNVINTGRATEYMDQTTIFTTTGETWSDTFSPDDPSQPVRITLTWSDAPGPGTGGNPAALINDLDLTVIDSDSSTTFLGNDFANGVSTTGGTADTVDNLENVFLQTAPSLFSVTVTAAGINGDGVPYNGDTTDQDFSLVCSNCVPNEAPICDANGPYTAECGLDQTLDGTGSFDPDGDSLSFLWTGPFSGGTAIGSTPTVQFPSPPGSKSVDLVVDDGKTTDSCSAVVTVQDTLPPSVMCNNPTTIIPSDAPIAFTATSIDQCEGNLTPVITGYDCFQFAPNGRRINKTQSCQVAINGDSITILDSGGVGDTISWTVEAPDGNGNVGSTTCEVNVVNPGNIP